MPTAAHCGEVAFPAAGVRPLFGESVFPRTPARYCLERMPRKTSPQLATKYRGLIRGVRKRWSTSGPRVIASKTYSPAQIVDRLQSMLDSIDQTSSAYAAWRGQVAKQRVLERQLREFVRMLESIIRIENGRSPSALADFGLEPSKKTGPRTAEAKAVMVEKAKATRIERHTMGKRQKQKIKGKP